jgi:hypothetical protein
MKRRGRKRKLGRRHPSGDLITIRESPAQRAAKMPHRRGVKDPLDQRAETELGRMELRGEIAREQALAGLEYGRVYRAYLATLSGPKRPNASGHGTLLDCGGCLGMVGTQMCICERRKRAWMAAAAVIAGPQMRVTLALVLEDKKPASSFECESLSIALWALAHHFGLTKSKKGVLEKAASKYVEPIG